MSEYQLGRDVERMESNVKVLVEKMNELESRIKNLEKKRK